jgi:hypothetical protein
VFATGGANLPVKTNKNKMTTEFEDHIADKKDLDVNIEALRDIGTSAANSSPDFGNFLSTDDSGKVFSGASRLGNIDENSLESEGRKERYATDNAYFDDFETDYTRPGAARHKKDAEDIVSATEIHIEKLTETLRKNGIDCKEVKNKPDIKDPYYIEIEKEEVGDTEYDQKFCEYLRNVYSCSNDLVVKCEQPTSEQAVLKPKTNIDFYYDTNGSLVLDSGGHHVGAGQVFNFYFEFDVSDVSAVKTLSVNDISFDDLVLVKFNGQKVYSGYIDGIERLELRIDRKFYACGRQNHGVQIDSNKSHVVSIEHGAYRHRSINKDLKPLLKHGTNRIEITLAVGGWGAVVMNMTYATAACKKWSEEWNDICKLK